MWNIANYKDEILNLRSVFSFFGFWNAPIALAQSISIYIFKTLKDCSLFIIILSSPTCMCFLYYSPSFLRFWRNKKSQLMHCRLSLSLHFQSLCSAMPSLLKEAGKLTNIQILYFKRISVQILFSIHRALHIFGLGEGTRGNSYFNRILLNYPLFRLSLTLLQTKHISVHLHKKNNM